MTAIKKTVSISSEIVEEVNAISSNFSMVVEVALTEYLRLYHVKKALESFGSWESRDHDSVSLVNELRKDEGRNVQGSH